MQMLLVAFSRRMCCSRVCSEAVGPRALCVDAHSDQPARDGALKTGADSHVAGVRAAVAQRHSEPLRGPDRDVSAGVPGALEQCQGEQVRGDGDQCALRVRRLDDRLEVSDPATRAGVLHEDPEDARGEVDCQVVHLHIEPEGHRPGADHRDGLGMAVGIDDEHRIGGGLALAAAQRHRLGGRRALIEQGCIGDGQSGEVRDHRLEVQEGLETSLADLGLVRRVRGVPGRVLEHVAQDHRRGVRPGVAQPEHRGGDAVLLGQSAELRDRLGL